MCFPDKGSLICPLGKSIFFTSREAARSLVAVGPGGNHWLFYHAQFNFKMLGTILVVLDNFEKVKSFPTLS